MRDDALTRLGLDPEKARDFVRRALEEDLQWGEDVTSRATLPGTTVTATAHARECGVLAGVAVGILAPEVYAPGLLSVNVHKADGERVQTGDAVLSFTGPVTDILTVERTVLNIICQLSGVATHTARWVDALSGEVSALTGDPVRVRDTRKTVPGMRILQKMAVRCGGGLNHRMGLGDEALIKDNHIAAVGSVANAIARVRERYPEIPVEVECDSVDQVVEAIGAGVSLILLDNMDPDTIERALRHTVPAGVKTEASGGLTLENAKEYAATGVDYIAVGALTHSSRVFDIGLDMDPLGE
ncbi:MAG: carboxylating nicotinate-nucleotide diphosphorylase [Corynebacterium glucuronolyticum]|nr:carboxylating nicotinate-nucleotide diphosphorylase [Corynebacterium glucuronolyticum]